MSDLSWIAIALMTQEEAEVIAGWEYQPPYDFYDWTADEDDLTELLDPVRRGDRYFSARDDDGQLVGHFRFSDQDGVVAVGLGLRPDLTGRGLGLSFLEDGLTWATEQYAPHRFRLSVAEFNSRAIKVYVKAGFVRTRSFEHETNGGIFSFIEMERPS